MGTQLVLPFALTGADLKNNPDLLQFAVRLDIESAERRKLEAMCRHIGFAPEGKSDVVLRRSLTALSCASAA